MIRCIIIEDEPMAQEVLKDYIKKIPFLELTGSYRNSIKALEEIQKKEVDLIFLDINMPDFTGIQFLKALENPPMIIFTTAYSQYAVESYNYKAVDYLLKPIEFDRFLKAAARALKQYRVIHDKNSPDSKTGQTESILIKSGTEYHQVNPDDIFFVEGAGNYVTFFTPKKKIISLMTMKNVLELLPHDIFLQIHKSYIVSFKHIEIIEKDRVWIRKREIPVGETYKENLQRFIYSFRKKN